MEQKYYVGFSLFPGVGSVLFGKLLAEFKTAENAWNASVEGLQAVLGDKLTAKFLAFRKEIDLEHELEKLPQKDIQLLILEDKNYPRLLQQIPHAPFVLYIKGDVAILSSSKIIGIVGTRKITTYGKQVTEMLTQELVNAGFITVSGLAFGVDATAHTATIEAGGKTIAVLGCGVDCCTPSSNQKIYDAVLATGGAIVSTFPPGMGATVGSFPARNALIAGLSQAILVTEGAADSGSLITANYAKKFSRPLFAVPGPITSSLSKGANSLIQQGAVAVTSARDIIATLYSSSEVEKFNSKSSQFTSFSRTIKSNNPEEQQVLDLLQNGPLHFDEIVRTMGKDSKIVGSLLSLMELSGLIHTVEGKYYL